MEDTPQTSQRAWEWRSGRDGARGHRRPGSGQSKEVQCLPLCCLPGPLPGPPCHSLSLGEGVPGIEETGTHGVCQRSLRSKRSSIFSGDSPQPQPSQDFHSTLDIPLLGAAAPGRQSPSIRASNKRRPALTPTLTTGSLRTQSSPQGWSTGTHGEPNQIPQKMAGSVSVTWLQMPEAQNH